MDRAIEEFLRALRVERGLSPHTIAAYRNDLSQFVGFLRGDGAPYQSWAQVDKDRIIAYLLHLRERRYAPATMARKVAALKSFFHFLVAEKTIAKDPTEALDSPKVGRTLPSVLTVAEVERLLQEPGRKATPEALRDRAMLELLYATGMRVSELVSLKVHDLNLVDGFVTCFGKGSKERVIALHPEAVGALRDYLQRARPLFDPAAQSAFLFLNRRGKGLTRQGFWLILKNYARAAQIAAPITPHTIRHSVATHLLRRGMPLRNLQELLGHASISSTEIYTHLTNEHLREVYERAHPRAREGR